MGLRKWSWDAREARRTNGCGNPVDREPGIRDADGRVVPEWRRRAILPPDMRPSADLDNPYEHPERFTPERMWAGYFEGADDPVRCEHVDKAVRNGLCIGLGSVAGIYDVGRILSSVRC